MSSEKEKLIVFDTTLRDGEQSPGASMTKEEKLRIAKLLERMKVDVIEAGFAISSQGDFEAIQLISENVHQSIVCSLSRAITADIHRAGEALKKALKIIPNKIETEASGNITPKNILEYAKTGVKRISLGYLTHSVKNFNFSLEF